MEILCIMRVCNSAWILDKTLTALKTANIPVIIHDDNSKDDTVKIAKSFDNVLEVFENKKEFYHEGIDKSILLNIGKRYNPDYFLILDDDEVVLDDFNEVIAKVLVNFWGYAFRMPLLYLWGTNDKVRIDGNWNEQTRTNLVPNNSKLCFPLKKCHCSPLYKSPTALISNAPIIHYGYNSKKKIEEKLKLYKKLGPKVNEITDKQLIKAFEDNPTLVDLNHLLAKQYGK